MTVPSITITDQGIIAPSTDQVVQGLWQMFKDAFGSELNTAMNTPQGQLVTSLAAIIQDANNQNIQLMNQVDPRYSRGIWQDAIGRLYFLDRQRFTYSTAPIRLDGLSGTIIPAGFQIADENGRVWETTGSFTIDISGFILGTVQCLTGGAIEAAPNTINKIIIALSGLDRATNPSSATPGMNEESRDNFEVRRGESVSANAKMTDAAVRGAVANLPGVVDVWVKSNPTDETVTVGATAYPMIRNSLLVSVIGGTDYDIAWQTLVKGGTGCSFNGNTEVKVYDTDTYPSEPPEYTVKFLRPESKSLKFKITIEDMDALSYQDEKALKSSILNALKNGKTRARIGQTLRAAQYLVIASSATGLNLVDLEVSKDGLSWVNVLEFGVDEYPVTTEFDISVVGL